MTRTESGYGTLAGYGEALCVALDERDGYTRHHCDRVVNLAESLGRWCRLSDGELRQLRLCAVFHDLGKIGIPDRILLKADVLDKDDWQVMRTHPERGQRLVLAIPLEGAAEIAMAVRHHHEHVDGSGYPDGLGGEDIHPFARMVAIADGYDAMATPRTYHRAKGHERIMGVLRAEQDYKYDAYLLSKFAEMIEESAYRAPSAAV